MTVKNIYKNTIKITWLIKINFIYYLIEISKFKEKLGTMYLNEIEDIC